MGNDSERSPMTQISDRNSYIKTLFFTFLTMLSQKIKSSLEFAGRYLAIGALFASGGLVVLLGVNAFQTSTVSPTSTGSGASYATYNTSTGAALMMKDRSTCTRAGAVVYENMCLEKMAFNTTQTAVCSGLNGWISFRPDHAWAVPGIGSYAVMRLSATNYTIGVKVIPYSAGGGYNTTTYGSLSMLYAMNYVNEGGGYAGSDSRTNMTNNQDSVWSNVPTFPWIARVWSYAIDASSTSYNFVCAYYRDQR